MASRHAVLGIEDGAFFHGTRKVFSGVNFLLDGARTALVGENGIGKSTLLGCLSGDLELNRGKIVRSRNLRVGMAHQEVPQAWLRRSVREVLQNALSRGGAADEEWRIDVLIGEIDPPAGTLDAPFGSLSGGWRRLLMIAAAMRLEAPDILLLDEPTNHLDVGGINRLEAWLEADRDLPMLVVSHDRAFLDRICERTLFLRSDGAHLFKVPFVSARQSLLERDAAAAQQRRLEEREIKRLQAVAARYKVWGQINSDFHKRQKATESRIARIEAGKAGVYRPRQRRLELADGAIEAKVALRVRNLEVKAPDGRLLVKIEQLDVGAGDRIAVLGGNGAGKSTLLNLLASAWRGREGHYDKDAAIRFNPTTRLARFDQAMEDLPVDESPRGLMLRVPGLGDREATRLLVQAGYAVSRLDDPVSVLSYGERARLFFLLLRLQQPNLYILDEPTSHLDIEGQEALESQLDEADMACLFVSHDRWFTRAAATRFLEIRRGRLIEVESADEFFEAAEV